jgi:hypothetical protein
MVRHFTPGTPESCGPARPLERIGALRFSAVSIHEFVHRHSTLELDSVGRHGTGSALRYRQLLSPHAHPVILVPNQVKPSYPVVILAR